MGEKAVFSVMAHVFQIDQDTKRKWIPSSPNAVKVSYYHDCTRKTYRIIAIGDGVKTLINSTITANMNFTKTSPKFGQWSDHRASTVYGLGFSLEQELLQFIDLFAEAKQLARELTKQRQLVTQEQFKPHPPSDSTPSPTSPSAIKSPPIIFPPVPTSSTFTSPSPALPSSAQLRLSETPPVAVKTTPTEGDYENKEMKDKVGEEVKGQVKSSKVELEEGRPVVNGRGGQHFALEPLKISNGHSSIGDVEISPNEQLDSLKSENNGLKMALAISTSNAKKWESEAQTLKSRNAPLQTALEESKQRLSQWKTKIHKHKEENHSLKKKVQQLEELKMKESMLAEEMVAIKKENEELKDVLSAVQIELEVKTEEAQNHLRQLDCAKSDLSEAQVHLEAMKEDKRSLSEHVCTLEDQLKMESMASQRKMDDVKVHHRELGHKLKEMLTLHSDLQSHLDT